MLGTPDDFVQFFLSDENDDQMSQDTALDEDIGNLLDDSTDDLYRSTMKKNIEELIDKKTSGWPDHGRLWIVKFEFCELLDDWFLE